MDETQPTNFLQAYRKLNEDTEIPEDFAIWCGVSAMSAALGRSVFMEMATGVVYANFYILLVASSGRLRKSTAIGISEGIVQKLEPKPNLIAQKITAEALISALQGIDQTDLTKMLRETAVGFGYADEMSNFLNRQSYDAGLGALLIPLFDCKSSFEYHTKSGGRQALTNCCLGLLAGTTLDWLRTSFPPEAIGGGLTSRIIFVYADKPRPPIAIPVFTDEKRRLLGFLIQDLHRIAGLRGEFTATRDAILYFRERYDEWTLRSPLYDMPSLSGYASRRMSLHLWKLGMILSAAGDCSKIITVDHLRAADYLLLRTEVQLPTIMNLITATDHGATQTFIFSLIRSAGKTGISRRDLLRSISHRLSAIELNAHLDMLIQSDQIVAVSQGPNWFYLPKELP